MYVLHDLTSPSVFGVKFISKSSSRASLNPGRWAAKGLTLATRSVHRVPINKQSITDTKITYIISDDIGLK